MNKQFIEAIDSEKLINSISERVTANILEAVRNGQPTPEHSEQLLTIDEAATLLHLAKATIYTKVSKNELPGVCKRGNRLYFDRQILIDWIKEGRKESNAEPEQEYTLKDYFLNGRKSWAETEQDLETYLLNRGKEANAETIKDYLLNKMK